MFGEMAADASMAMGMGMLAAATTSASSLYPMLSFQQPNPDSTIAASAPALGAGVGPNTDALFLPLPMLPNPSASSSSSSLQAQHQGAPKYKFVTGSPADWTAPELALLNDGLIRYAHEPSIVKYIKIAAMLPTRTIRDIALRCCWTAGKESMRRKPDELYVGKNKRDSKEKMVASTSIANFQTAPLSNVPLFSILMYHTSQNSLVLMEDNATQHLLEENNRLLSQIAANIETFKMEENMDLFLRTNNNIRTISERMSETPGIMGQMPSLPVPINDDHLNSVLQLNRVVRSPPCEVVIGRSTELM